MEIGIAGLPGAGKTLVFKALAGGHASVGPTRGVQVELHRAVVSLPDPRMDALVAMFRPKSVRPAEVRFLDPTGLAREAGPERHSAILAHLRTVDALLLVVAAFSEGVTAESRVADLGSVETDLILSDLEVVERRLDRLDREVRMARGTDAERQTKARELELLRKLKDALDREQPVRSLGLGQDEHVLVRGYGLLSAKPALAILNIGDDPEVGGRLLAEVRRHAQAYAPEWLTIAGRLETELAELEPLEAREFMEAMGVQELSTERVIQASYRLLDLISFFTVVSEEVRSWPIRRGSTALDAAAAIHTDLARGFIRAEVVSYSDLMEAGGIQEARRRGKLRSEGKSYVVQDGDVINILFHG